MINHYLVSLCAFFIASAGMMSMATNAEAVRRFNPDELQQQIESSGADPDQVRQELQTSGANMESGQSHEDWLEALRGDRESSGDGAYGKSAADVEIPTGTHIIVKLDKTLDSAEMGEGEQFDARLQGDLVVNHVQIASGGDKVYGKIITSSRAKNRAGTSVLEFKLTGMLIENQMRSIESNSIRVESTGSGKLHANASIEADTLVDFSIGEPGSDPGVTETIAGPDKKVTDRMDERRQDRRHRRD